MHVYGRAPIQCEERCEDDGMGGESVVVGRCLGAYSEVENICSPYSHLSSHWVGLGHLISWVNDLFKHTLLADASL